MFYVGAHHVCALQRADTQVRPYRGWEGSLRGGGGLTDEKSPGLPS